MGQTTSYDVAGMTCEHCVNAVTTELGRLAGVSKVHVELSTGTVAVTSDEPIPDEAVRAAVAEAGYEVAS